MRNSLATSFAVGLLLLGACQCIFDEHPSIQAINSIESLNDIREGQKDNRVAILAVWHEDSTTNLSFVNEVAELVKQNDGLFQIHHVDCEFFSEEELSVCVNDEVGIKKLPKIILSVPNGTNSTELIYSGSLKAKDIAAFAKSHMPNHTIRRPSMAELQSTILPDKAHPKVVLFTNKEESAPLLKALTSIYFERIVFIEIHSSQQEVVSQFQIQKYPTLMVLSITDDNRVAATTFTDQLKMQKLILFLDKYALKERVPFTLNIKEKKTQQKQEKPKFQSAFTEEEEEKKFNPNAARPLSIKKYEKTLLQEDHMVVLHIAESLTSAHLQLPELLKRLDGGAVVYELILDTPEKVTFAEKTLKVKAFPAIKVYPFSKEKKAGASSSLLYGADANIETIIEEIDELIEDESFIINDEKMFQMAVQQSITEGLIAQIMFYNEQKTPLAFKIASKVEAYRKKMKFVSFRNAPKQILQQFGITAQPRVAMVFRNVKEEDKDTPVKQDEIQASQYQGKLVYSEYSQFLNMLAGQTADRKGPTKKVQEITSISQFEKACKTTTRYCFLALLNGEPTERLFEEDDGDDVEDEAQTKLSKQLKTLKVVKDKLGHKPVSFGWIDAVCHAKIFGQLGIDSQVPSYIVYSAKTKQYARLVGRFEESNLEQFSLAVLGGKRGLSNLSQELQFEDGVDCVAEHARIKKELEDYEKASQAANSEFDDEIQREMMEEERQRKLKLEAELKADRPKKKKSSKSKRRSDL